ncbi:SemiSWEET transporter [Jidongwangia harbinensis]|uniref:SemiSWEET transporter n=1 Tax=Jidongwangia harbinensis TaxID=2878561 RepID=UPI001CD9EB9C|nr:SemiSWEET transporter [Jidongwangia harbinensis]MCA2216210.1 SemiSWEET transporter [Jidongwangia harbinensis]
MLTSVLGVLAAALTIALPWPQVWRCWIGGRTTGLSASSCWLGAAMPIGWMAYGLLLRDPIQVVTNVGTGVAGLAVLAALLISRRDLRRGRALLATASTAGVLLIAVVLSGLGAALPGYDGVQVAPMLGAVLAIASIVSAVPQPLSLLRDRRQDLSGVSPLRWQLAAAACACWLGYGIGMGQAAVWASGSAGLLGALVVCVVLVVRKDAPVVASAATVRTESSAATVRTESSAATVSAASSAATVPAASSAATVPAASSAAMVPAVPAVAAATPVVRAAVMPVVRAAVMPVVRAAVMSAESRPVTGAVRGVARVPVAVASSVNAPSVNASSVPASSVPASSVPASSVPAVPSAVARSAVAHPVVARSAAAHPAVAQSAVAHPAVAQSAVASPGLGSSADPAHGSAAHPADAPTLILVAA